MRHISFETARTWIERLAGLPAPVRMEDIPGLAAEFGWEPTNIESRYRYEGGGDAQIILASGNDETGKLYNVNFDLVRNWREDFAGNVVVVDWWPRYVEAFCAVWGEPWSVMTDPSTLIWKLHEQGYVEIYLKPTLIACYFTTSDWTEERW
ncbi:hypothetical protein EII34_11775 [Arachnia propionica]|uniref:Uncharacterized protein n=1 Tax=Arachnia propionica TaxID=1750 RepID=A0A3P1T4G2_9ACTN|nr:DUF6301 family protein [Arachnia propionica]RRD04055.1 hypothetical protein EII34_11775 [Arachnia propionica]